MNETIQDGAVRAFYDMLNAPGTKDVAAIAATCLAPDWRSYSAEAVSKGRDEFVAQVVGFGKFIPDLAWKVKEVVAAGDRVVVRSEASGTPAGDFMGVPHGGRTFRIMTIDIHRVEGGRLKTAHHIEDWASALRQLAGR